MSDYVRIPVHRGWDRKIQRLYGDISPIGGFIAGGHARWMASTFSDSVLNPTCRSSDIDIFCVDEASYSNVKALFLYRGMKPFAKSKWALSYLGYGLPYPVQLIKPVPGDKTIDDFLGRFDFSVCRAIILDEYTAYVDYQFEEHEKNRRLAIRHFDMKTVIPRLAKYLDKGYSIGQFDLLRVFSCTSMNRFTPEETERLIVYLRTHSLCQRGLFKDEFKDLYDKWHSRYNTVEEEFWDEEKSDDEDLMWI